MSNSFRSDQIGVLHSQRIEDVVAEIAVQRLPADLINDLSEHSKPMVAVRPLRPRLNLNGQATAVVLRKRRRSRSCRSDARTDGRLKQVREPPPVTHPGSMCEELSHGRRPQVRLHRD
jgi:hypothetical protein